MNPTQPVRSMRSTSVTDRRIRARRFSALLVLVAVGGCTEFSHFGQVSDRQTSSSVNNVRIEQKEPNGNWRLIGHTDGKGAWNIFKHEIHGNGQIRLSKPGYRPLIMEESEFLSQNVILLSPTHDADFSR